MQLRIAHTTGFEYDGKANTSFNEARLTPLTLPARSSRTPGSRCPRPRGPTPIATTGAHR